MVVSGRTYWITGASSGLGRSLAERLCGQGNRVIVTARSRDALQTLHEKFPDQVSVLPADISVSGCEEEISAGLATCTSTLDTAILNAGGCEYLDVNAYDHSLVERVAQVNYLGFSRCLHAALPLLRKSRHRAHLVGISSASVFFGLPRAEAYGASKAALTYFLKSLRNDLVRADIDVSIVNPGFVDTPLTRKNDFPMPGLMNVEKAADIILKGIDKRKPEISFPWTLIWTLKMLEALPIRMSTKLAQRMVRDGAPA